MNEKNHDKDVSKNIKDEGVSHPRNSWSIALIGLPDSGKSTFLARLYGAKIADEDDVLANRARFSLSFPSAIAETEEERKIFTKIHELWNWIRSNFDDKLKTLDSADLTFYLDGPGLKSGLAVHTKDLPGEAFKALPEVDEKVIEPERLKDIKGEIAARYKRCNAALMLIDCNQLDSVPDSALIRSMLGELPKRTRFGMPVFKLVVFTKAGNSVDPDNLKKRLKEIERTWRAQGIKWVKVIACESLNDLTRKDAGGKVEWSLPQAGKQPPFASWIHTPSTAILELPRMLVSYRRRRNVKLTTTVIAMACILAGSWIYQGRNRDQTAYNQAVSQPEVQRLEALEKYLLDPARQSDNWYYPIKHHLDEAGRAWNALLFTRIQSTADLESQRDQIKRVEKESLWSFVDKARYKVSKQDNEEQIKTVYTKHDKEMERWKFDALKHDDPVRFLRDASFDYTSLPSLNEEVEKIRSNLLKDFQNEAKQIQSFRSLCQNWRTNIPDLRDNLNSLSTATPMAFKIFQVDRQLILCDLAGNIDNIGIEHVPQQSSELLAMLHAAVLKQLDDNAQTVGENINSIREKATSRISDLERLSAEKFRKFENTEKWDDKVKIAQETQAALLDIPAAEEWRERAQEWGNRLQTSETQFTERQRELRDLVADPNRQCEILRGVESPSAEEYSPTHRALATTEKEKILKQCEKYANAWKEVCSVWASFETDKSTLPDLQSSMDKYRDLLRQDNRPILNKHQQDFEYYTQGILAAKSATDSLEATYNQAWSSLTGATLPAERTLHRRELQQTIQRLHATHKRNDNEARIKTLLANVRSNIDSTLQLPGKSDTEFQETLDATTIAHELVNILDIKMGDISFEHKGQDVMKKWAQDRWNDIRKDAENDNFAGNYNSAIQRLDKYRTTTNTAYRIFEQDASVEIEKNATAWADKLVQEFGTAPVIRERSDYDSHQKKMKDDYDEILGILGERITSELTKAYRDALNQLDTSLSNWYTERINSKLKGLRTVNNERVLDTWEQLDKMEPLFVELSKDEIIQEKFKGQAERAAEFARQFGKARSSRTLKLQITNAKLTMPLTDDYGGDKFPEPKFELNHNENTIWSVHIEKMKNKSTDDNRKQHVHYNVSVEGTRFILTAVEWNNLRNHQISYKKDDEIYIAITIHNQKSPPMRVSLLKRDQVPGALVRDAITVRNTVDCKTTVRKKDFKMELDTEMTITVDRSDIEDFILPASF